jgi:hypothetical protein
MSASGSGSDGKSKQTDAALSTFQAAASDAKALNEFLAHTQKRWAHYKAQQSAAPKAGAAGDVATVHVVMGNEAADTDSIVCAIVYAYYQYTLVHAATQNHGHSHSDSHSHSHSAAVEWLPVINIPRQYLALRQDTVWLLQRMHIDAAHLTFIDEVQVSSFSHSLWCVSPATLSGGCRSIWAVW